MVEKKVAFYDITDNMDLAEEFIKYCVKWALDNCADDVKFLNDMFDKGLIERLQGVLKDDFVRLPYTDGIKILEEDAGVHFLMKVDTNLSEEEFLDKMKSKWIKLAALSSYYHSSEKKKKYENIYVMNYSFVDCEKMEYVAKIITLV